MNGTANDTQVAAERRTALRALLLTPLLTADGPRVDDLLLVRSITGTSATGARHHELVADAGSPSVSAAKPRWRQG